MEYEQMNQEAIERTAAQLGRKAERITRIAVRGMWGTAVAGFIAGIAVSKLADWVVFGG